MGRGSDTVEPVLSWSAGPLSSHKPLLPTHSPAEKVEQITLGFFPLCSTLSCSHVAGDKLKINGVMLPLIKQDWTPDIVCWCCVVFFTFWHSKILFKLIHFFSLRNVLSYLYNAMFWCFKVGRELLHPGTSKAMRLSRLFSVRNQRMAVVFLLRDWGNQWGAGQ